MEHIALKRIICPTHKDILPCPCCGNKNLYIGPASSNSQEIHCMSYFEGCGLRLIVNGDEYPMKRGESCAIHNERLLNAARERWNKRI